MIQPTSQDPGAPGTVRPSHQRLPAGVQLFLDRNLGFLSSLVFFVLMLAMFTIFSPGVFLHFTIYTAVFVSLPVYVMLTTAMVFVVVSGEIDLCFPSTVGMCGYVFAGTFNHGWSPWLGLVLAIVMGLGIGLINGVLVTYVKLSSLVATLGMQFLLFGIINVLSNGTGIVLTTITDTSFYNIFSGTVGTIPSQMFWGIAFAGLGLYMFNRHVFGSRICCVGDNADAAKAMGIDPRLVKIQAFMFMGFASAIAGVIAVLINTTFYPTNGQGYLLTIIAAVFIGGTPTWGGVGTIAGAICGACTVGFIETGLIAVGLSGFWTNLFYGLVIVLSLMLHRFNRARGRTG
jgi:ribose/xylose/arabinose/galactoside ABC-type transport system permease subunit